MRPYGFLCVLIGPCVFLWSSQVLIHLYASLCVFMGPYRS